MAVKLTDERARLASLIERLGVAERYVKQIREAQARAPDVFTAVTVRDEAAAMLEEAKQHDAAFQIAALVSGKEGKNPVAAAEVALAEADAALARARQTRDMLDGELSSATAATTMRRSYLPDAIGRVIGTDPNVAALLDAYRATQARLVELSQCLSAVSIGLPHHWDAIRDDNRKYPSALAWREAVERLKVDAAAEFPAVD